MIPAKLPTTRQDRRKTLRKKLKSALDLMTWGDKDGNPLEWDEAARAVNFNVSTMRKALERPHVRQYLTAQRRYLRDAISAKNPRRLARIADGENAAAAVRAVQVLEGLDEQQPGHGPGMVSLPGLVIQIVNAPPPIAGASARAIDHGPLTPNQRVGAGVDD